MTDLLGTEDSQSSWIDWCRLCAKDDSMNNLSVFCKSEYTVPDTQLATAIGKYFWVNIKADDNMPKKLCADCYKLITELIKFTDRINKVQALYTVLSKWQGGNEDNAYELRQQFDIWDESREHIMAKPNVQELGIQTEPINVNKKIINEAIRSRYSEIYEDTQCNDDELVENDEKNTIEFSKQQQHQQQNERNILVTEKVQKSEMISLESEIDELEEPTQVFTSELTELEINEDDVMDFEDTEEHYVINSPDLQIASEFEVYDSDDDNETLLVEQKTPSRNVGNLRQKQDSATEPSPTTATTVKRKNGGYIKTENRGEVTYICKVCSKNYKNVNSYRKHLKVMHHMEPDLPDFECEKCSRIYPTKKQLEQHKRSHLPLEEKAQVPCPFCEKKFTKTSVMVQHVAGIHYNEKPYVCDVCGRCMKTLAALNEHKLVHTNECPFECEVCQKRFKNKARLKLHMDTHTDTNYQCNLCDAVLNTRRTLKMHMVIHTDVKQFACPFCSSCFKRSKALKNHLILHNGLRPYVCNFCDKSFANGSNCRSHKKKAHPKELAELEAKGQTTPPTKVPQLKDLKSPSQVKNSRKVVRTNGGLSPKTRAMIIAAEQHPQKVHIVRETSKTLPIAMSPPSINDIQLHADADAERDDNNEVFMFEIIEEI